MSKKPVGKNCNGTVEYERRFIVKIDYEKMPKSKNIEHIKQAYISVPERKKELRLRITNESQATYCVKNGKGMLRSCQNMPLGSVGSVGAIMEQLGGPLEKVRKRFGRWKIDIFEGKWRGLTIAEYVLNDSDEQIVFPDWMQVECEITGVITNLDLFKIASYDFNLEELRRRVSQKQMPWIVLTGGPCSGKSSILQSLQSELQDDLVFFPEIATIVINQIGLRPDKCSTPLEYDQFQESIYYTQTSFETSVSAQATMQAYPKKAMIIDRGTVDCIAYISGGIKKFENLFKTTLKEEYNKYSLVICLGLPDEKTYNEFFACNPARYESYEEAMEREQRIVEAWHGHKNFHYIPSTAEFSQKCKNVEEEIKKFLQQIK